MQTAYRVDSSADRTRRLCDGGGFCALQGLAYFPTVGHLRTGGTQRFERCFGLSSFRSDPQGKTSPVDPPVVGIEIRIKDLQRGTRLQYQAVQGAVVVQPSPHGPEIV